MRFLKVILKSKLDFDICEPDRVFNSEWSGNTWCTLLTLTRITYSIAHIKKNLLIYLLRSYSIYSPHIKTIAMLVMMTATINYFHRKNIIRLAIHRLINLLKWSCLINLFRNYYTVRWQFVAFSVEMFRKISFQ